MKDKERKNMANIALLIYDKPRKWIRECRANDVSWDEIERSGKTLQGNRIMRKNECTDLGKFQSLRTCPERGLWNCRELTLRG